MAPPADTGHITVLAAPAQALIVDCGRTGWRHLAITTAGAYDRAAYARANRLVGNAPGSAAIEFVFGPLSFALDSAATVAITGITAAITVTTGTERRPVSPETTIVAPAAARIDIAPARGGLRGYIAIRGGFDARPVLGSRSSDTLSGLGPPLLGAGDTLPRGRAVAAFPASGQAPQPSMPRELVLNLLPPPRPERYEAARIGAADAAWTVSADSDRIGLRLSGASLTIDAQAASEPLVRGAVQVPPDGQPVIMGPDHPVTGGYPVIGVVDSTGSDLLAQARPGAVIRFRLLEHP